MAKCLILLTVLLRLANSTGDADSITFIRLPVSQVVYVNTVANFLCEVNTEFAHWNVNGTDTRSLNNTDLDATHSVNSSNVLCTLHFTARAVYNESLIECVASEEDGGFIVSQNATLLIQGLLAPVGDVRVQSTSYSILLSWSPPFSLDVTGVDPDIWYTVLISNVTDEHSPVNVPCDNCTNIIRPQYNFTTANPSPSNKYSFTVIPQNGVGEGSRSEPVVGAFVDGLQPSPTVTPTPTPTPTSSSAVIHFLSSVVIIFLGIVVFKLYIL